MAALDGRQVLKHDSSHAFLWPETGLACTCQLPFISKGLGACLEMRLRDDALLRKGQVGTGAQDKGIICV